jgi:hypothetical protein
VRKNKVPHTFLIFILVIFINNKALSQRKSYWRFGQKFSLDVKNSPYSIILSGHVVDDDGKPFNSLFNVKKSWNFWYFPAKFSIGVTLKDYWTFGFELSNTIYKQNKIINNEFQLNRSLFLSADAFVKYDLNELVGYTDRFDPFVLTGYGYTLRTAAKNKNTATFNFGLGTNFWIWDNLGINVQTQAKFALIKGTSNYLNHSVGAIYKFNENITSRRGTIIRKYKKRRDDK